MKKCIILFAITAIILSFFPSNAHALGRGRIFGGRFSGGGGCFSGSCVVPCVAHAEIVETIVPVLAYPVLVPAFQFQYVPQAYAATVPVIPVAGYPVAAPLVQPVISTANYGQANYGQANYGQANYGQANYGQANYGQQQQPYQQQQNLGLNNNEKIRELAKAIIEEMSKIQDSNGDFGPPSVPGTQPQPQPQPQQRSYNQQQLSQFTVSAMARTCAVCHTGIGAKGDMIIFTQPGLINQQANWKKIKEEVSSGRMPPKDHHFQLSFQERQGITQWLQTIGVN
jgi:hypothetical protein